MVDPPTGAVFPAAAGIAPAVRISSSFLIAAPPFAACRALRNEYTPICPPSAATSFEVNTCSPLDSMAGMSSDVAVPAPKTAPPAAFGAAPKAARKSLVNCFWISGLSTMPAPYLAITLMVAVRGFAAAASMAAPAASAPSCSTMMSLPLSERTLMPSCSRVDSTSGAIGADTSICFLLSVFTLTPSSFKMRRASLPFGV